MSLATLSSDDVAARLSGSPEERAAIVRAGAESGIAEAQAVHAQMLLDAGDRRAALAWFTKAAAQHHVMALNMVGRCYDLGWGTSVDKHRAAECYLIAAERGLDWAMYNYATLLTLGEGVPQDRAAALTWLERAAALGNAKAMNFIGSFAEDGWACDRDMTVAAHWYERAADGGDFRGCFNHARMLGTAGRTDEALVWLVRAGETGNPPFVEKATAWLRTSDVPGFATHGVAALRGDASC